METQTKNKGGRPQGSMSKLAHEAREQAKQTGLLPHEILLSMARGEPQKRPVIDEKGQVVGEKYEVPDMEQSKDAAKAAAPYFAPKISTVEFISGVTDDNLDAIIAQLAAEAGVDLGTLGESTQDESEESEGRSKRVTRTKLTEE